MAEHTPGPSTCSPEDREALARDPVGCTVNVLDQLIGQAEVGADILDTLREFRDELRSRQGEETDPSQNGAAS